MSSFFTTGGAVFIVLSATLLTIPAAFVMIWLYERSVRAAMRRRSDQAESVDERPATLALPSSPLKIEELASGTVPVEHAGKAALQRMLRGPWRSAVVYGVAGIGCATFTAIVLLISGGTAVLPLRLLVISWIFAWPVVLTTNLLTDASRVGQVRNAAIYALVPWVALGFNVRDLAVLLLGQAVPTLFLLAFMHRKVRTLGPLVFTFMAIGVTGASLLLLPLENAGVQRTLARATVASGLDVGWWLVLSSGLGFAIAAVFGWLALRWIEARFTAKQISDQSLSIDSIWLLFAVFNAVDIGTTGAAWGVLALGSFAVFRVLVSMGFAWLPGHGGTDNYRLVLLRVFGSTQRSQRLMAQVGARWRYVGSIEMIVGTDLATSTLEPHEFLEFVRRRLANRYIHSRAALEQHLGDMDLTPDFDQRFRVNEFFCYDNTWRMTLSRLILSPVVVLMDLRGFTPSNQGCVFELRALINLQPLDKVLLIVDTTTDVPFLRRVLEEAWAAMPVTSPNLQLESPRLGMCRLTGDHDTSGARALLARLAQAATDRPARLTARPGVTVAHEEATFSPR